MNDLKFGLNRYLPLLTISILFTISLQAQTTTSEALRDSVESLDTFPNTEHALPIYQRINKLSKKEGNRNLEVYSKIYTSYFNDALGNTIESDEEAEEAFRFVQDTTGISPDNTIMAYHWMQQLERKRGNLYKANNINKKYIELELINGANDVEVGVSYLELASSYRILGDFENAILYSSKAYDLFINAPDSLFNQGKDKNIRLCRSLQIRGLTNKDIKNYQKSIEDYKQSLYFLKKSKNLDHPIGRRYSINYYGRMAHVLILNNELEKASKSLLNLAPLIKDDNHNQFRYHELSSLLSLKKGDLSNVSSTIQKAIELAGIELKEYHESPEIARLKMIYGDYYIAKDSLFKALQKYHEGLQYFDSNLDDNLINNPDIHIVPEGGQALQLLKKKAETLIDLYHRYDTNEHLINGISTYKVAIGLVDKLKSDFINEGSKYKVAEIATSIYPKALEANFTLYKKSNSESSLNSIFNIIEKNKAEILFQNINSKYNLLSSALPEKLIKEGIDLKYNISYYSKLLAQAKEEGSEEKIAKFNDKLFKLKESDTFYDQKIKDEYPEFYKFKNEVGNQISLSDLKGILKNGECIIEYFQTETQLYSLHIKYENANAYQLPMKDIGPILSAYFQQISKPPATSKTDITDITDIHNLSQTLAKYLIIDNGIYKSDYSKIIVIPDGIINKLPYESLIVDESGTMLIETSTIAYNYSASQFLENQNTPNLSNPRILCLTPIFDGYTSDQRNCKMVKLGNLPHVKKEFDYLKSNFPGSFFYAESANLTNLKSNFADHQIVHLATHACLNNEDPMLSQIYFYDGSMTNYDIQNLNSRPELVVLSACNTASGNIQDGEGIIGLSRGFFEAGVKGIQSSLWSIDDLSSSEIVKGMYHYLKKGASKSQALRLSKLDYLTSADKLRSHPYYWAALIHIGNDNPIDFSTNKNLYIILLVLILGICLYFFQKGNKDHLHKEH